MAEVLQTASDHVETDIFYFSRNDKFSNEKPYTLTFPVDHIPGAQVSNHEFESRKTKIRDVRGSLLPDLNIHGFTFVQWETAMSRDEFESPENIIQKYYPELVTMLKASFPHYKKVAFFDNTVRRRVSAYPEAKGTPTTSAQPYRYTHVDYTAHGAKLKLKNALGEDVLNERLKMNCDIINIWRLINDGPTRDWPLAFCDWRTIDINEDLIPNDVVYPKGLGESCFLRSNPNHAWWYLQNQEPNEVVIFRNVCLNDEASPHDVLRESIEVRLAAFY
ncbi:hypothetical protein K449DRAFT_401005 [Hypoxylon sp. EC38]|nr:hypothetical protein K449DRAFT_401005 [Hypoxylon sp. EC38]